VLIEVPRIVLPRAVAAEHFCLVLPHLLRNFRGDTVNRGIHVGTLVVGLNGDMVRAMQDDFRTLAVLGHVEDNVRLDDPRIVEMDVVKLGLCVFADRIRDADMATGDSDGDVYVSCLHNGYFVVRFC